MAHQHANSHLAHPHPHPTAALAAPLCPQPRQYYEHQQLHQLQPPHHITSARQSLQLQPLQPLQVQHQAAAVPVDPHNSSFNQKRSTTVGAITMVVYEPPAVHHLGSSLLGPSAAQAERRLMKPFLDVLAAGHPMGAIATFVAGWFCCPVWVLGLVFLRASHPVAQAFGALSLLLACLAPTGALFAVFAAAMGY